jgi:hypothetical protein
MSLAHHPPLRDITADTEITASSIVACWTMFSELRVDQIRYNITSFTPFLRTNVTV